MATAVPLFLAGVYLASLFIDNAVGFFTSFTPEGGSNIIAASVYLGFVMRTILAFGIAFLLPVVLVGLNLAGLLSGRAVLKSWRWVLVLCLTFAAVATPTPDVTAMLTLAAPMIVLFALAIGICLLVDRRRAKKAPAYLATSDDEASAL
jgi:sec-independent protein translocase protein TatC